MVLSDEFLLRPCAHFSRSAFNAPPQAMTWSNISLTDFSCRASGKSLREAGDRSLRKRIDRTADEWHALAVGTANVNDMKEAQTPSCNSITFALLFRCNERRD